MFCNILWKTATSTDEFHVQAFTQARLTHCEVVILMAHNTVYVCQAIGSEMFINGPMYRFPFAGQPAFTPLDAMRVMASAFYVSAKPAYHPVVSKPLTRRYLDLGPQHRACLLRAACLRVPTIAPTPTKRWLAPPAFLSRLKRALSRVWDEVRLATCRSLRVQYVDGRVVVFDRSEPALTGRAVCWPLFPVLRRLGYHLFREVTLHVGDALEGGHLTFAWRGTLGATSVVVKTDLRYIDDWTEREATQEWERLALALPHDARVASALPIPAYYGLFVGAHASIIVMSDCGEPISNFPELEDRLR